MGMTMRWIAAGLAAGLVGLALLPNGCGDGHRADAPDAPAVADAAPDDSPTAGPDGAATTEVGAEVAAACSPADLAALELAIAQGLDVAVVDPGVSSIPDVTLLLETMDGRRFSHSHGVSSATTSYESASTSKLVTAVVVLDAVDHGFLTLESKARDLLPFWTESQVTLRHLLSFTSGFSDEPLCIDLGIADFAACAETIFTKNVATAPPPGSQFAYSSAHMQIAGLMTMRAKSLGSWSAVFDDFKARTGLFATSAYDLPSANNPRLAGGMHWTAEEYLAFLRALVAGKLLSPAARGELFADQRGEAAVVKAPTSEIAEDWSYGLGNWLECPTAKTAGSFDCGAGHRNSSPGAYGAYPFVDFDSGYFGILARQGGLRTYPEGVKLFRAVEPLVREWAAGNCGGG